MEQQVGLAGLFEGGLERGDQAVRQVPDEADRVGQQRRAAAPEPPLAGPGVERGEQLVLDQHPGVGQGVHEGALAGVGVADERDGRERAPAGDLALLARLDLAELGLQLLDPVHHQPAVFLKLLFARAADADPALVAGKVGPHPLEPRQGVLELRQLDLEVGLVRLGVGREDVEDDLGPVDDLDLERPFEVPRLPGAQVVVEDHQVGLIGGDEFLQFLDLAGADVGRDVHLLALLQHGPDHVQAGRLGQPSDLVQRIVDVVRPRPAGRPPPGPRARDVPDARCGLYRSNELRPRFQRED